ncbi:hypothetical protein EWM64_g6522 [Hericium alpestre]|uniref:Dymeclin n=1 Tax=Hericium alpestre TaxID=135208 RepID=A0A4Y9ZTF3_9AGAM|nr:hypothetical protein EWM64_g6522 [Hericium alpestre]
MDMDVDMEADMLFGMDVDATPQKAREKLPAEDFDEPEPPDWAGRLHQIVFMHTLPSKSNTFQTLLSESSSLGDDTAAYNRASSAILDALGSLSKSNDADTLMRTVSRALLQMANLLHSHNLVSSFTALLNLLTTLIISIPRFIDTLFASPVNISHRDAPPPDLLATLCHGVVIHLTPDRLRGKDIIVDRTDHIDLAKELVTLLDAIIWSVPTDYETRLNTIPRTAGVFSTLLNPAHSKWFLRQSTRLVSLLTTRTNNFRHLLSFPDGASEQTNTQKDYTSIPHIDQMCALLSDPKKSGSDADVMRHHILSFFTLLATSHPDALTILAESKNLLPSLVVHLCDLTTPLWEEDAALMSAPAQIDVTIEAITHTLLLLHYLVFRPEQPPSLRQKLHQARHINGIHHTFVVTLGRLAC